MVTFWLSKIYLAPQKKPPPPAAKEEKKEEKKEESKPEEKPSSTVKKQSMKEYVKKLKLPESIDAFTGISPILQSKEVLEIV